MRRADRLMAQEDALQLLEREDYGILSTASQDGVPYGVPLNYCFVREDNAIIFHCANKGRKIDDMLSNPRVSFAVVGRQRIDAQRLTTRYESVIVSGRAVLVTDETEKIKRFDQLCAHLTPGVEWRGDSGCKHLAAVAIVRIDLESITGKRNAEV